MDARLRVVVTGGAGFIGSRVATAHAALGNDVLVLDDLSGGSAAAVPDGAELAEIDISDARTTGRIAEFGADLVIHAAAQVSVARSVEDPALDWAVNVTGTRHVVEGARSNRAARLVFLSSGGAIYGDADGADESMSPRPKSPYGHSKLEAEAIIRGSGLSHGIARLANVYGPGQRSDLEGGVVAIFIDRCLRGLPVEIHGNGTQVRDLIFIDDVVAALAALGSSHVDGTWNVGTGVATSIMDLLGLVRTASRSVPLGNQIDVPNLSLPAREGDVRVSRLSIAKIERDLGWRPSFDLAAGLAATVQQTVSAMPAALG